MGEAWYCERKVFGGWAAEVHPEGPPYGRDREHRGEVRLKTLAGILTIRRLQRIPSHLVECSLTVIAHHFGSQPGSDVEDPAPVFAGAHVG